MQLTTLNKRVIGMDVHQSQVTVCAIIEQDGKEEPLIERRRFSTFKNGRKQLAQWVLSLNPDEVVMESTGIYWKSPYAALEDIGIFAKVVNARHVKNVPGRKTDICDAQWLATLSRAGLLNNSFIPPAIFRELRVVSRNRQKLVGQQISQKNRLHKILTDAGIRLNVIVSDLHGKSASAMVKAIVEGKTPEQILNCVSTRLKADRQQLLDAVQGELSSSHIFVLKNILNNIEQTQRHIQEHDDFLLNNLQQQTDILNLLQTLPGVNLVGAAMLIVEIGIDMDAFGSADKISSWVGVCPGNNESAGKRKPARAKKGNRYVRRLLCEFAHAASRTKSSLKEKFQSILIRKGYKKAIIALAHKMLRIIFIMIKRNEYYRDSATNYEELVVRKNSSRWIKALYKYNYLT